MGSVQILVQHVSLLRISIRRLWLDDVVLTNPQDRARDDERQTKNEEEEVVPLKEQFISPLRLVVVLVVLAGWIDGWWR